MWNSGDEQASASWGTRPAGRTAEWFREIDRLSGGGRRNPALPDMADGAQQMRRRVRLAAGPRPLRPALRGELRLLALGARRS